MLWDDSVKGKGEVHTQHLDQCVLFFQDVPGTGGVQWHPQWSGLGDMQIEVGRVKGVGWR